MSLSQVDAAAALRVPAQTYRNWLHGRYPIPDWVPQMCEYRETFGPIVMVERKSVSGVEEVNFAQIKAGDIYRIILDSDEWNIAECDAYRRPDDGDRLGGWTTMLAHWGEEVSDLIEIQGELRSRVIAAIGKIIAVAIARAKAEAEAEDAD
jgi:hypothetical protein